MPATNPSYASFTRIRFTHQPIILFTQLNRPKCANANGVASFSPGWRASRYSGASRKNMPNPERFASSAGRINPTPSGLCQVTSDPRVARASQPWAERRSPFGARGSFAQWDCEKRIMRHLPLALLYLPSFLHPHRCRTSPSSWRTTWASRTSVVMAAR